MSPFILIHTFFVCSFIICIITVFYSDFKKVLYVPWFLRQKFLSYWWFLNRFIELLFTNYAIHPCNVYNSLVFSVFIGNVQPSLHSVLEHFHCLRKNPAPVSLQHPLHIPTAQEFYKYSWFLYVDLASCNLVELISSSSFFVDSWRFSIYMVTWLCYLSVELVLLVPFFMGAFISFSCLIVVASSSVLTRMDKNRCAYHHLGKHPVFHSLSTKLVVSFS